MSVDLELLTVARNYAVKVENEFKKAQKKWTERFESLDDELQGLYKVQQEHKGLLDCLAKFEQTPSLAGEVGILRLLLEQTIDKCQDNEDLLKNTAKISNLVELIAKLVKDKDK